MTSGNRNNHRKLQLLGCSVSSQEIDQFPPDSGNSTLSLDQKRISLYFFHLKIPIGFHLNLGILNTILFWFSTKKCNQCCCHRCNASIFGTYYFTKFSTIVFCAKCLVVICLMHLHTKNLFHIHLKSSMKKLTFNLYWKWISQNYLPSILIVAVSWVSFWMDIESVPGRFIAWNETWNLKFLLKEKA